MVRVARPSDPQRLAELKRKINDTDYIDTAIQTIALRLTNELVDGELDDLGLRLQYPGESGDGRND